MEFFLTRASEQYGVLSVDVSGSVDDPLVDLLSAAVSDLVEFAAAVSGKEVGDEQDVINLFAANADRAKDGMVKGKPSDYETLGATTAGDLWQDQPSGDYYFDMFGSNLPSYGLQTVYVTGQRLSDWWNFNSLIMTDLEYNLVYEGGVTI